MAHPDELDVRVTFSVKIDVAAWDRTFKTGRHKAPVRQSVRETLETVVLAVLEEEKVLWQDRELAQS